MQTAEMSQVIGLVHSQGDRLAQYLAALPEEAWSRPSACGAWTVADVVAHLAQGADTWRETLAKALAGETPAPPPPPPSSGDRGSQAIAQRAISFRQQIRDDLLGSFTSRYDKLGQLLMSLGPQDWEKPCHHPRGVLPVRQYVSLRVQELTLHGWDIRAGLEEWPEVWEEPMPVVVGMIPRWLGNSFRPDVQVETPLRFRFDVVHPIEVQQDVVVQTGSYQIEPASNTPADVTLSCDTSTYILLAYGRRTLQEAEASGRLAIKGNQGKAVLFPTIFQSY